MVIFLDDFPEQKWFTSHVHTVNEKPSSKDTMVQTLIHIKFIYETIIRTKNRTEEYFHQHTRTNSKGKVRVSESFCRQFNKVLYSVQQYGTYGIHGRDADPDPGVLLNSKNRISNKVGSGLHIYIETPYKIELFI